MCIAIDIIGIGIGFGLDFGFGTSYCEVKASTIVCIILQLVARSSHYNITIQSKRNMSTVTQCTFTGNLRGMMKQSIDKAEPRRLERFHKKVKAVCHAQ